MTPSSALREKARQTLARRGPSASRITVMAAVLSVLLVTGCWRGRVLSAESSPLQQPTPDATLSAVVRQGALSPVPQISAPPATLPPTNAAPTSDNRQIVPTARPRVTSVTTRLTTPVAPPTLAPATQRPPTNLAPAAPTAQPTAPRPTLPPTLVPPATPKPAAPATVAAPTVGSSAPTAASSAPKPGITPTRRATVKPR